jgi:hypothetical protein
VLRPGTQAAAPARQISGAATAYYGEDGRFIRAKDGFSAQWERQTGSGLGQLACRITGPNNGSTCMG